MCVSILLPSEVSRADHWLPILFCGRSSQPVSDSSLCHMHPAAAVSMDDHKQTPAQRAPLCCSLGKAWEDPDSLALNPLPRIIIRLLIALEGTEHQVTTCGFQPQWIRSRKSVET